MTSELGFSKHTVLDDAGNEKIVTAAEMIYGDPFDPSKLPDEFFWTFETIKFQYPILQNYCWLTPLYEIRHWIKLIFTSDAKHSLRTLKTNVEISVEKIFSTADLLKVLGL